MYAIHLQLSVAATVLFAFIFDVDIQKTQVLLSAHDE